MHASAPAKGIQFHSRRPAKTGVKGLESLSRGLVFQDVFQNQRIKIQPRAAYHLLMARSGKTLQALLQARLVQKAELWRIFTGRVGPNVSAISYNAFVRELGRWQALQPPLAPEEQFELVTQLLNRPGDPLAPAVGAEQEGGGAQPRRPRDEPGASPVAPAAPPAARPTQATSGPPSPPAKPPTRSTPPRTRSLTELAHDRQREKLQGLEADLGLRGAETAT